MESNTIERVVDIVSLIVIGVVLFFTIARLFFGVDLTDEAYTVAETYMVANGALPFVNNWSQMPGYTLLLAPFVKIYTWAVGGTEGIVLFFRFLAFSINALTAIAVSWLLKDYIKNRILLALLSMIYVGATGWDGGVAFRGDLLAVDLLAVGVLLIVLFFVNSRFNEKHLFLSGGLLSLSVLSYPTLAILFAFWTVAIFVLCRRRKQGYNGFFSFLCGAFTAALMVVAYLALHSGVIDIFAGIQYLLKDVIYFQIKNEGIAKLLPYCKDMTKQLLNLLYYFAVFFVVILMVRAACILGAIFKSDDEYYYIRKFHIQQIVKSNDEYYYIRKFHIQQIAFIALFLSVCICHFELIWRFKTADHTYISLYARAIEVLAVPLVWYYVQSESKICKYLMGLVWFPSYTWVVVTGIIAYGNILQRHVLIKNAAFLLVLMTVFAVHDQLAGSLVCEKQEKSLMDRQTWLGALGIKAVPVLLMMAITFTHLFNSYSYVYRDESIFYRLDTVVPEGPYRGMRTTKMRADGLIKLDKVIDSFVSEKDYLLAMDNDPFIYLMSEGKICTPSSWDQALYSYGFDQPDLYFDYFNVVGREPSKIIYFNYGRDKIMSIDTVYKFNDYVKSHYNLVYEDRDIFRWRYCGKDIVCELLVFGRECGGK